MTEKQVFLDKLTAALYERNISESDIRPYIEQFDRFYDRMVSDSQQTQGVLQAIETIADNIAAQVSDRYDEINRLAERTMTVDAVTEDAADAPETDAEPTLMTDISDIANMSEEYELAEPGVEESLIPAEELAALDVGQALEYQAESIRLPDYNAEEPIQNSKMFWILFCISLPITFPLFIAIVAVFAAMWLGLAAVVIAAMAALVALVAGGAAISLVGIIYGIIQLFSSVPLGLYEIGLGVIVAGSAMFAGILVYNFAVRLVPILMRMLGKLFRFVLSQLKRLFNFLRRECVKL